MGRLHQIVVQARKKSIFYMDVLVFSPFCVNGYQIICRCPFYFFCFYQRAAVFSSCRENAHLCSTNNLVSVPYVSEVSHLFLSRILELKNQRSTYEVEVNFPFWCMENSRRLRRIILDNSFIDHKF